MKKELDLDEKALSNLHSDRQRFLCKAVENYIHCLEQGREHDTWVFRLTSLWLENAGVRSVDDMMKVCLQILQLHICLTKKMQKYVKKSLESQAVVFVVVQRGVKQIPSYKFLPLMYQLAARMGTKMAAGPAGDVGFSDVLNDVISLKTNVMFWPLDFTELIKIPNIYQCYFYLLVHS